MLLELHAHSSRHSPCSQIDPLYLTQQVKKKGLQGVIFTEHHYLWADDEIISLKTEAELGDNFLILAGQEVETDCGHILVFGADKSIEGEMSLKDLRKLFPEAALIWAHPFRYGKIPDREELLNPLLDAVEIFGMNQSVKENYVGLKSWHRYKFTAISGSDTHAEGMAGVFPTQFDHPVTTMAEIVTEIKNSRCRPFLKEIPRAGTNIIVTEITIGTKGEDESRNRMILKEVSDEKKWKRTRESVNILETLHKNGFGGGTFRVPRIIDINDKENTIIEEGQRGRSLFELLVHVNPSVGIKYFELSAKWLAKLHNMGLKIGNIKDGLEKEIKRFEHYRQAFIKSHSPYVEKIEPLIDFVREKEEEIYKNNRGLLIQSHGDFHPKNIIIGQDRMHDISTLFISVIDFDNSALLPCAFDIGYFLSQFQSQFYRFPQIINNYKESDFIASYLQDAKYVSGDFENQAGLFKIRANLSIASYLIKVGKGQGPEMDAVVSRSVSLKPR